VNPAIARLFGLVMVLFALLVAFTSRWTVFEATALKDNPKNARPLLEQLRVDRGDIRAADGTVLARSAPARGGTFARRYPTGALFAQVVGYSFIDAGRTGLERRRNDSLMGDRSELRSLVDQLRGRRKVGDDVVTTLDPAAQRIALQALGDRAGAVVALEPRTGRVRVMASTPSFDPNTVPRRQAQLNRPGFGSPQLARPVQGLYSPGSTFKVVTAAAALDSGRFTPQTMLGGDSGVKISGVPLNNFGGENWGPIDLRTALTQSVNTVWAQVGERLGTRTMARYMKSFGFYGTPPLDYPSEQMNASGERAANGRLLRPTSGAIDVGRMAIGQDKLAVTPLQMAMVAATIANGGVLMAPRLTRRIVDPDGRVALDVKPRVQSRPISPEAAAQLTDMMRGVVDEGTGTAVQIPGIPIAGKTGTAEIDTARGITQPWFIAFAPAAAPRFAIAVVLDRSTGTGGTVAAPIARQVLQQLLRHA